VYKIKGPMFFEGTLVSLLCKVNLDAIIQRINRRRKYLVTLCSTVCHVPYSRYLNDCPRRGIEQTVYRVVYRFWSPDLKLCNYLGEMMKDELM
jgi:hypothetical protein